MTPQPGADDERGARTTDDRGSGRTWRALAEVKDGGIFVIPNAPMANHARRLLAQMGRHPRAVRMLTPPEASNALRGVGRVSVRVDHATWELCPQRDLDELNLMLSVGDYRKDEANAPR